VVNEMENSCPSPSLLYCLVIILVGMATILGFDTNYVKPTLKPLFIYRETGSLLPRYVVQHIE